LLHPKEDNALALPTIETRRNGRVHSLCEWRGYVIHVWVYLQLRNDSSTGDFFSEKSLTQFWYAMQQSHPNLRCRFLVCFHSFRSASVSRGRY